MVWMPLVLEEVAKSKPGFRFLGLDIARPVVDALKTDFADRPNWCVPRNSWLPGPLYQGTVAPFAKSCLLCLLCQTGSLTCWI